MFTIHQVRLGLATNSSSMHSLIILPGGAEDSEANGAYGWDFFTCASKEAKLQYAAIQLRDTMTQVAGSEVAQVVAESWTGTKLGAPDSNGWFDEYVDHQSRWTLPLDWDGKSVDKEFFDDLKAFLEREDVAILGGNDNTEESHPLDTEGTSFQLRVPLESDSKNLVCRKDDGYWTIFNRETGTKIRMSFHAGGEHVEPTKAKTPELVDVKITDFCPYNCEFCYQDSTMKGEHADANYLSELARTFRELRVFEVAIGGGEPTLHPKFVEILRSFRNCGIVPNFTTKNLTWINDHGQRDDILKYAGAFAYSIESAKDITKLAALRDTYHIPNHKLNCQYVMGTARSYEFEQILTTAAERRIRVTLLGYKTNGRGDQFEPKDYSDWAEVFKKVHDAQRWGLKVGIDTALAAEYQGQLADLGVPKWCYEIKEGKFSMYIDAVAKKSAKSSYGPSLTMRPLKGHRAYSDDLMNEITQHFAAY